MSNESSGQDSLDYLKSMWNNMGFALPGMVTPTLDVDELAKRIADLKAVEGWLKMNLNMLQMSIQGLEMQRVALATIQAIGHSTANDAQPPKVGAAGDGNPYLEAALNPALWPWNFMQPPPEPPAAAPTRKRAPRRKTEK